jgi:hypothetical protein
VIEDLTVTSAYLSDHVSNYATIDGRLPDDKTKMLSQIDAALERLVQDTAYRANLEGMRHLRRL